jgi:hypothetical protein
MTMTIATATPADFAWDERVRDYLISRARAGSARNWGASLITYEDVAAAVDPGHEHFRGPRHGRLRNSLYRIATAERAAGRPLLVSLVVRKDTRQPGDGFFTWLVQPGDIPAELSDMPVTWWGFQVRETITHWSAAWAAASAAVAAAS